MKRISFILVLFCLNFIIFSKEIKAEKILDRVVARVNSDVILLSDYEQRANSILAEYEKVISGPDKEKKIKELKENILNQIIDEKLLVQKANKIGIRITNAEIDQGIDEIRARFGTEVEFQNEISKQGFGGEVFRKNVSKQLLVIKLINQNVQSRISPPTEAELKKYYKEHESEMISPEQIRARHILIKTNETRTEEEAKEKVNDIYQKVKSDPSKFSSLAEKYSEGPSAKLGGDLGYFSKNDMVKEFEEVAFNLDVGDVSKPVKTRFGYHIIKLTGKKSSEEKTYSEVKDRLKNLLYQIKMEAEYEKFLRNLRDEAKIIKLLNKK